MAFTLLFQKTDDIATGSTLNSGATSTTLTSGNFGTPSGQQYYVVDYDIPASAEIILASVTTTAMTSIVRGLAGGAAGTTNHAAGAKIASIFVPQHYATNIVHVSSGTSATGTTLIPFDNTIPQISEGTQFLSATITPTSATNKLVIEIVAYISNSAVGHMIGALFQDVAANALAVGAVYEGGGTTVMPLVIRHEMTAGTTSATTFKFRAGVDTSGTMTFNGAGGSQTMGGAFSSHIRITEIKS